jgi:hypothetical protein
MRFLKRNKVACLWIIAFAGSLIIGAPSMLRDWSENGKLQEKYRRTKYNQVSKSIERDAIKDAIIDRLSEQTCRIALQAGDNTRYAKPKSDIKVDAMAQSLICFRSGEIAVVQDDGRLRYLGNIGSKAMAEVAQNVYEGSIEIKGGK